MVLKCFQACVDHISHLGEVILYLTSRIFCVNKVKLFLWDEDGGICAKKVLGSPPIAKKIIITNPKPSNY